MSSFSQSSSAPTAAGEGRMIVARGLDGKLIKGTTHDFHPRKPSFHLYRLGDESSQADEIAVDTLKAVFFVRNFDGLKYHEEKKDVKPPVGQGRRIEVTFTDGEVLAGTTMGYNPNAPGFFMLPADQEGNNLRIYVVNKAVSGVKWL